MAAHEETWRTKERNGETSCAVYGEENQIVADCRIRRDMARALLALLPENGHTMECGNVSSNDYWCSQECRAARNALVKAGVR